MIPSGNTDIVCFGDFRGGQIWADAAIRAPMTGIMIFPPIRAERGISPARLIRRARLWVHRVYGVHRVKARNAERQGDAGGYALGLSSLFAMTAGSRS